jgi:hypothetical protein
MHMLTFFLLLCSLVSGVLYFEILCGGGDLYCCFCVVESRRWLSTFRRDLSGPASGFKERREK